MDTSNLTEADIPAENTGEQEQIHHESEQPQLEPTQISNGQEQIEQVVERIRQKSEQLQPGPSQIPNGQENIEQVVERLRRKHEQLQMRPAQIFNEPEQIEQAVERLRRKSEQLQPEPEQSRCQPLHCHHFEYPSTAVHINGYTPWQIRKAYRVDGEQTGNGFTVAIVSAYDYPTIVHDAYLFGRYFGLPRIRLEVVYARGVKPEENDEWAVGTSTALQWAYAMAPMAQFLVVLAKNNTLEELMYAVDVATAAGADVVNMSWGTEEFEGQQAYDEHFIDRGTAFVAGAGNFGGATVYPAASPYVVAAGGTTLWLDRHGDRARKEQAWDQGGGGPSRFYSVPSWQLQLDSTYEKTGIYRGTPDVAFNANPFTGVAVYNSTVKTGRGGWRVSGGTGVAAAAWSAIVALLLESGVDQAANMGELLYSLAGKFEYAMPQHNYTDIANGSTGPFRATPGWDFCTGLGSPVVCDLVL